jgi:predicted phage terminase large subunit-like protein
MESKSINKLVDELESLNPDQLRQFLIEIGDPNIIDQIIKILEIRNERKTKLTATSSLADFVLHTEKDYDMNWHHKIICDAIDDFLDPDDETEILILQAPPRTGKTNIVGRSLPAYVLGKRPDTEIVYTSYGASLSKKINRDVQRIMTSDKYREIFPDSKLKSKAIKDDIKDQYSRTSEFFEVVGKKGSLRSVGVGGGLTGSGFNLGISDDLIKDMKQAMSPSYLAALWDWYTSVFYTRRAPKAKIILMFTRWSEDDVIGRVLDQAKKEGIKIKILSFPMLFEVDYPYPNDLDLRSEQGEPLWENRFNAEFCEKTKKSVGTKVWNSLYQQRPTPAGGSVVKRKWFKYYKEKPQFDRIETSWDFTFSDSKKSDYVAGGVWGIAGANRYLLHIVRDQMAFTKTVAEMVKVADRFRDCTKIIVEAKANGPAIIDTLSGKIMGIIPFIPTSSKEARATAVAPLIEAGNIWLPDPLYYPEYKDLVDIFVTEWASFPNGKTDDLVDMTSQFLLNTNNQNSWLDQLASEEQSSDYEYLDKIKQLMGWS